MMNQGSEFLFHCVKVAVTVASLCFATASAPCLPSADGRYEYAKLRVVKVWLSGSAKWDKRVYCVESQSQVVSNSSGALSYIHT